MGFESIDQFGWSPEFELNTKMSISFFWLERGCRWGSSPLTSLTDHQKLNVIQKQAFHSLAGEGWWMEFESIDQPGWSPEIESNPKMSISLFWLEMGGGWGLNPLTSPADHQKLNIIQKQAFHFFGWRGVTDGVWVHRPTWPIIRSWMESKNGHFIFLGGEGWQMWFESIHQPSRSSEVERNPKISISFFWLERGSRWGLSPLTSPADHHKLNVMQKWAFYFMPGERWQMGFESIDQPSWSSEGKCNPKMSISFFFGLRGQVDGVWVHWPAQPIIRS